MRHVSNTLFLAFPFLLAITATLACARLPAPASSEAPAPMQAGQSVENTPDRPLLSPGTGTPKRGGVIRFSGNTSEPAHLDASLASSGPVLGLIYSSLLEERADFYEDTVKSPGLIEKWEISPDGKAYTLYLRRGVKWQNLPPVNGRELVASDVAWNIDKYRTDSIWKSDFDAMESYQVTDPYAIVVKLKFPFSPFLDQITGRHVAIMPKEIYEQDGSFRNRAVSTGAWSLDKWEKGTMVRLKANPDYWDKGADGRSLPYADAIEMYVFPDMAGSIAAFRAGRVDVLQDIPLKDVQAIKRDRPDLRYEDAFRANVQWLMYNFYNKPWDDLAVRQAACNAINQQDFIDLFLGGDSQLSGLIPSSLVDWAWPPEKAKTAYAQDQAKARELLKSAGFQGMKAKLYGYAGPVDTRAIEAIQQAMNAVGFDITLQPVPSLAQGKELLTNRGYDLLMFTASTTFEVDDWTYLFWNSKGGRNQQGYSNPEMDRLTAQQRDVSDPAKRKATVDQIQNLMVQDMVACPLGHLARRHHAVNPVVKNLKTLHWSIPLPTLKQAWLER